MFIVQWSHLGIMQPCNNRCNSIDSPSLGGLSTPPRSSVPDLPVDVVVDAEEEVSYRTDCQFALRSRAEHLFFPDARCRYISASSSMDHAPARCRLQLEPLHTREKKTRPQHVIDRSLSHGNVQTE
jgi:hypothetical protein